MDEIVVPDLPEFDCCCQKKTTMIVPVCPLLRILYARSNRFTTIDFSINTTLTYIDVSNNLLTNGFDVSSLQSLTILRISGNKFTSLDFSRNISLREIECTNGQLTQLILPPLSNIEKLDVSYNYLSEIDTKCLTNVKEFIITKNEFIQIDMKPCVKCEIFMCNHNYLTKLDVTSCVLMVQLWIFNNRLKELPDLRPCIMLLSLFGSNNPYDTQISFELNITNLQKYNNRFNELAGPSSKSNVVVVGPSSNSDLVVVGPSSKKVKKPKKASK